jgi:hypothetical protein
MGLAYHKRVLPAKWRFLGRHIVKGGTLLKRFSKSLIKIALLATFGGVAASANAWIVLFGGTYTNPYTNFENLTIHYETSDLLGPNYIVNLIQYHYTTGVSNSGHLIATSLGGQVLDVNFSGGDVAAGGTHTMYGTWTANIPQTTANTAPTGTYSASFDGLGDFDFAFVGQAAPEPPAYGVVALGLGGLLIRRRKMSK